MLLGGIAGMLIGLYYIPTNISVVTGILGIWGGLTTLIGIMVGILIDITLAVLQKK